MQMKTFSGPSAGAVLAQIKAEFGTDAVILETREENGLVRMTAALERTAAPRSEERTASPVGHAGAPPEWDEIRGRMREWDSIKGHLLALMKPALQLEALNPRRRLALEYLQGEGVGDEVILSLYRVLREDPECSVLEPLAAMVPARPWGLAGWPQRFHLLCGPFGAGKTTVGLRMALALKKEDPDLRIAFINADASRGNGRMLLRHYCELSDFACKEAASTVEAGAAVKAARAGGYDRVFIDLPGLPKDRKLAALPGALGLGPDEAAAHLVLGPHYAPDVLGRFLERYHTGLPGSLVWTRLDEAERYGALINASYAGGLPISGLSYGPSLGDSFTPAREKLIWKLVFKRLLPSENGAVE